MEEEIDLRRYIEVLLGAWTWIVGLGVGAAAVAFLVSSLMAPTYEAKAIVVVTGPRYLVRFETRMQDVPFNASQFLREYSTIATSDAMLRSVAEAAGLESGDNGTGLEGLADAWPPVILSCQQR
jgi:uncharacterized protein involved in exopolysaccharide biosynthesis